MVNTNFATIKEIKIAFPDEESCILHLEKLRWKGNVVSPFDPNSKVYCCTENRYRCRNTGKYFNVKTNSLFYNSRIELQKWFIAIWLVNYSEKPISSSALSADLKITQKTAWFMLKNIKAHFQMDLDEIVKPKKPNLSNRKVKQKSSKEIEVVVATDKLQMSEWLQLLKK